MGYTAKKKTPVQWLGLVLFGMALLLFVGLLTLGNYELNEDALKEKLGNENHWAFVQPQVANSMRGQTYGSTFAFTSAFNEAMTKAQADIKADVENNQGLTTSDGEYWNAIMQDYVIESARFPITKASSTGKIEAGRSLYFWLTFGLGVLGALMYILPKMRRAPGIQHDHVYHSPMHSLGWLGILTGTFLIGFYVLLYFYPEHIVGWTLLLDPISMALNGNGASQWFVYGFLYTVVIIVMGIRMMIKYRHNKYQLFRTGSVMFFQTAFAFLIPEILYLLNQPSMDFKNIWPLDYDFFFQYNIQGLIDDGTLGIFMIVWGVLLIVVAVPFITYFFGKRWYCSWVCGCGGLAETLGDPYRQLSSKKLSAWNIERYLVHAVLVFAVVMTLGVLYTYLPPGFGDSIFNKQLLVFGSLAVLAGLGAWFFSRRKEMDNFPKNAALAFGATASVLAVVMVSGHFFGGGNLFFLGGEQLKSWYGFAIGATFSGVVGTGFYPLMGNRVWCRFGCPLAAYLGIVQRLKSRFRITTNGGQCISCGNCSTYCEMGIDVRSYAQKGQDIVRASCVGCGICSAVCPRGVLRLENSSVDTDHRTLQERTIHIYEGQVGLLTASDERTVAREATLVD